MSIVTESNVPNLVLQLNAVQRQIYYRGMYKDIPDNYWKEEIGPKLYPLWDTDKDKLILFTWYDNNTYHAQRRKFIKDFKINEYVWKDYEMEMIDSTDADQLFNLFKDTFYLIDSLEKENYKSELADAYYESKTVSWYGLRLARNFLLSDCDWTMLLDADLTEEEKAQWVKYRQVLRNIPQESLSEEASEVIFPITPPDWKNYYQPNRPDEEYLETKDQYLKLAGHHLANFKERIFQHVLIKQSVMNPLNYRNYRDKMAELSSFQTPQINQKFVKDVIDGVYVPNSEENVLDYLIKATEDQLSEESDGEQQ